LRNAEIELEVSCIMEKVILDTDIGTDVDDAWALAITLAMPEIELVGVTTVYGNTRLRAAIVRNYLNLTGSYDIPVLAGEDIPLDKNAPNIYWNGLEKQYLATSGAKPEQFEAQKAVEFITQQTHRSPGEITLICIGPLTNIAAAIKYSPDIIKRLKGIIIMGGGYRAFRNRAEHNFKCDPESAQYVLRSAGHHIRLVGYNVTERCRFSRREFTSLLADYSANPFVAALKGQTDSYLDYQLKTQGKNYTYLHDPLAVTTLVSPKYLNFEKRVVYVDHRHKAKMVPINVLKKPVDWQVEIEMAERVNVRDFKGYLRQLLSRWFMSI
jgi:purine nucleosidase